MESLYPPSRYLDASSTLQPRRGLDVGSTLGSMRPRRLDARALAACSSPSTSTGCLHSLSGAPPSRASVLAEQRPKQRLSRLRWLYAAPLTDPVVDRLAAAQMRGGRAHPKGQCQRLTITSSHAVRTANCEWLLSKFYLCPTYIREW